MLLLPAPDPNEPVYSIGTLPFDEDAYRHQLMADVVKETEDYPYGGDIELATDILLDYAEEHRGEYSRYDVHYAMCKAEELQPMLVEFAAGWDAAVALMQR